MTGYARLTAPCTHNYQGQRGIRIIFKHTDPPVHRSQPDSFRLPMLPKAPSDQLIAGVKWPKGTKNRQVHYGEEMIHNKLVLGQYGVIAVHGGSMSWKNYNTLKNKINKYLDPEESFAIMRFDPPYKPVTSKSGRRHGGGKGNIKFYTTPIKAGRVIFEIGGKVEWIEVQPWLSRMASILPFEAIAVNQDLLDRLNASEDELEKQNLNPMTTEWFLRNNILDCQRHFSPWDIKHLGKFTYRDRHNNLKWNLSREWKYKSTL